VFEVNSSPSIREAEVACGVDLAARIVDRAIAVAGEWPVPARRRGRLAAASAQRSQ
jgi:ribosomal protein S6--L-glutamate ligase